MTQDTPTRAQDVNAGLSLFDEVLADMLADGMYMVDACRELGLSRRDVYRRLSKDQAFADMMNDAVRIGYEVKQARLDRIAAGDQAAGSTGDWKRDQLICKQQNWALERLHPGRYGPKVEVTTTNKTAVRTISDDPVEAARQYREIMEGH